MNPLLELRKHNQSVWLNYIRRDLVRDGGLKRLVQRVQRHLLASTGTKNHAYSDVLYVEELIGPDTVNTLPPDTLAAFRDHGRVRGDTVLENEPEAKSQLRALSSLGVDLNSITDKLQIDGVASFASAYDRVLDAIARKVQDRPHVSV